MKRKIISTITLLMLIAQMILPGIVNATNEGENKTGTDINNTQNTVSAANGDLEIGGNGSFGTLLADSINEQNSDKSNNGQVGITNAEIESNIAKVTYFSNEKATIIVAIYNEEKNKIITTSKKDVDISEEETEIEIEVDGEIPQYFVLKAFMIDKEKNPLCDAYENSTYTQEMQKLLAMTTNDFDADRVLNIDDKEETNFAIYKEETIIVNAKESGVTLKSADEVNQIYVFENINDKIRNLKKDDILSYVIDEEQEIIVKVSKITINGNSATISGGNLELEEVFDYVKIETDTSEAEFEITESEDEGITYLKDNEDNNMFGASADEGEIGFNKKASFLLNIIKLKNKDDTEVNNEDEKDDNNENKKEDDNEDSNKDIDQHNAGEVEDSFSISISGKVDIETSISLKYYHSVNETYIEYNDKTKITFSGTISGKISIEIPLATGADLYFPVGSNKKNARVIISYIPKFVIEVGASLTFSTSFETGEKIKVESGKITKTDLPTVLNTDNLYEFKASVFVGFKWEPTVKFAITRKVFSAEIGIKSQLGVEITASYGKSSVDTTGDIKHDCGVCLDGKVNFVVQGSVYGKLSLFETEFSVEKGFNFKYKITDFYISISRGEFGLGICPHKKFLTTFKVVDENGNIVEGAKVSLDNGSICIEEDTDNDGNVFAFLNSGDYFVTVKKENKMAIKKIHVVDKSQNIKVKISQTLDIDGANIQRQGEYGENAYFIFYDNGLLFIDGTGALPDCYTISYTHPIWGGFSEARKVIINEGITSLGEKQFYANTGLEEVVLPNSLEKIDASAFAGCSLLQNIVIPENVKIIGAAAFYDCTLLREVSIPKNIKDIETGAFYNTDLKTIIIPKTCLEVGESAFSGCENLEYVSIASKIIGERAFKWTNIKKLDIKSGVDTIKTEAFKESNIADINIENGLKHIGQRAFDRCNARYWEDNENYEVDISIPSSVEKIEYQAFSKFGDLNKVSIASKKIGEEAFTDSYIKSLEILGSVEEVGDGAFSNTGLENLIIHNGVKYIGRGAFYDCEELKSVNLPKSVLEIGYSAFGSCGSLEDVTVCNGKIGEYAFAGNGIKNLTLDEGVTRIEAFAFSESISENVIIPASVTYIGSQIFLFCHDLNEIWFLGDMPEFAETGFGSYSLSKVYYPNTWKNTPESEAFYSYYNTVIKWIPYDISNPKSIYKLQNEENSQDLEDTENIDNNTEETIIDDEIESTKTSSIKSFNAKLNNFTSKYEGTSQNIENCEEKTSSFKGLVANENYIIYVVKEENTDYMLSNSNILYIDQGKADENGEISFTYIPKEETEKIVVLLYGKENNEEPEEQIYITGDVNGDGKVSLLDYGLVLAHVKRTKLLTGEQLERADVNGDKKVSLLDYGLILAHVKRTKLLF